MPEFQKSFELNPVQARALVQLWASPERMLFAEMSKQYQDRQQARLLYCDPEELREIQARYKGLNEFFVIVHNTAVKYGLPGQIGQNDAGFNDPRPRQAIRPEPIDRGTVLGGVPEVGWGGGQ